MSVLYTPDGSTSEENRSFQNFGVFLNGENIGASVPNISSCGSSTLLSFLKGKKIYAMKNDNNGASWLPTSPWYTIYTSTKTGYVAEDTSQFGNQPKVAGNSDCSIIYSIFRFGLYP